MFRLSAAKISMLDVAPVCTSKYLEVSEIAMPGFSVAVNKDFQIQSLTSCTQFSFYTLNFSA